MKMTYKRLGVLATIGYLFGILVVTYFLLILPQELENETIGLNLNILSQLNLAFVKLHFSIAMVLALGMTASLLLLFNDIKKGTINTFKLEDLKDKKPEIIIENPWEQDGLTESDTANIKDIIAGNENLKITAGKVLTAVCSELEASQGALYVAHYKAEKRYLQLIASFAYPIADSETIEFEFGEGLVGQSAKENRILNIDAVPEGYIKILSGLGSSTPTNLLIVPFKNDQNDKVWGVIEIASFHKFSENDERLTLQILSTLASKFSKESSRKKVPVIN